MSTFTKEQIRHKVINVSKTLKLLERLVDEEEWSKYTTSDRSNKWLKAQSVLAGVNHCREVLRNVTPNDYDFGLGDRRSIPGQQFHEDAKVLLDRLECDMLEINQELKPRPRRHKLILPTLPQPSPLPTKSEALDVERKQILAHAVDETLIPVGESELRGQVDVPSTDLSELPSPGSQMPPSTLPNPLKNPASILLPPSLPSTSALSGANAVPGFLETSTALQEDLSEQLAQMARQLKLNAQHFSEALAKDQGVVQVSKEKVEQNYDDLTKERIRLRDHSGKSRGTTCLVLMSIVVVIIGFMLTFFVIRIT
ncbi:hypothetical protein DFH11DRAFT_424555 [Phellopilus nigrolimitatus]|nr:hypothetical protein DFH11DRAFT_424555 [Phellopilus nigrolimitatus]